MLYLGAVWDDVDKRKRYRIVGLVLVGLWIVVAAEVFLHRYIADRYTKEGKAYVDATLPSILKSWDAEAFRKEASPDFFRATTEEKLDTFMTESMEKFGSMQSYGGASGEAYSGISCCDWIQPMGRYGAEVVFEKQPATIWVWTVRRDGKWKILEIMTMRRVSPE